MLVKKWEKLPSFMQKDEIRPYWEQLRKRNWILFWKRMFDVAVSFLMLLILCPLFLVLAIAIKIDSKGPVFFRQLRVTQYGKQFRIHKFRSMAVGSDRGCQVTIRNDTRVTIVGRFIRKYKLDEVSQLIDVLQGNMSFVGTRPEVPKYVASYTPQMMATLLLPAGITNEACINFKNEADLLEGVEDIDRIYIDEILPKKMKWNLLGIKEYGFWKEIWTMFRTFFAVLGIVKPREFIDEWSKSEEQFLTSDK